MFSSRSVALSYTLASPDMRCILFLVAALPSVLVAQSARPAAGRVDNGFSTERLQRADAYLQQQVDNSRIAGAVGLVLRDGKVVYERAVGWADKESGRRMTSDAMLAYGSQYRVDPSQGVVLVFMLNQLSNRSDVGAKFPTLIYQALTAVRH